jgi:hypothetical protein
LNNKIPKAEPSPGVGALDWQAIFATLLVGCAAFCLVALQYYYAQNPNNQTSLINLNARVLLLEQVTNHVQRDILCIPLAADGRALDGTLAPDARVFMADMLGPTNAGKLGFYYFMRNYLFPRDVEISLDGKAISADNGFSGVPCDSQSVLKAKGFDLMIRCTNNEMRLISLTPKGMPKNLTFQYTNIQTQLVPPAPGDAPKSE